MEGSPLLEGGRGGVWIEGRGWTGDQVSWRG